MPAKAHAWSPSPRFLSGFLCLPDTEAAGSSLLLYRPLHVLLTTWRVMNLDVRKRKTCAEPGRWKARQMFWVPAMGGKCSGDFWVPEERWAGSAGTRRPRSCPWLRRVLLGARGQVSWFAAQPSVAGDVMVGTGDALLGAVLRHRCPGACRGRGRPPWVPEPPFSAGRAGSGCWCPLF